MREEIPLHALCARSGPRLGILHVMGMRLALVGATDVVCASCTVPMCP